MSHEQTVGQTLAKVFSGLNPLSIEESHRRESLLRERDERDKWSAIQNLRSKWNAPARQVQRVPVRENEWGVKLAMLSARIGSGFMAALVGGRGTGKSQMGVELMKHATESLRSALFVTATEFFIAIKTTYHKDSTLTEKDILDRFRKPKLLVIDEVGKRAETEWQNLMLFELINKRYEDMTDTVLIDNRTKAEFETSIGPSLASRINETGGIIEAAWPSFRI